MRKSIVYYYLFLLVMESNNFKIRSGMLNAYMFINVVGLLALHAAVRTLKSRRTATLEPVMAQHMMHVTIAPLALRARVSSRKFIIPFNSNIHYHKKLKNKNLLTIRNIYY